MRYQSLMSAFSVLVFSVGPAFAQGTVGNGTTFLPPAGARESYGINATSLESETSFTTRHYNRSNDLGIGGSFIGTTSPTSESSPAVKVQSFTTTNVQQFRLPKLDSAFTPVLFSPALQSTSPALPLTPSRSTALDSPVKSLSTTKTNSTSVESLPSFSNMPSVTDQMRFDIFGN